MDINQLVSYKISYLPRQGTVGLHSVKAPFFESLKFNISTAWDMVGRGKNAWTNCII